MNIIEFFEAQQKKDLINKIKQCDWGAAKFLAKLLEENDFHITLGHNGKLYIMEAEGETVAFLTLAPKDCIDDDSLFPWIGFVYVAPEYRGNRISEKLIQYACQEAKKQGHSRVYIATDHVGLYEKYGFIYMENRIDVWGEDSRILYKEL